MYRYDHYDQALVDQRVAQFRDQISRRLSGEITEDEFKPLRLQNGVYMQLHAYMLRVAIPYGLLSSDQLRMLAQVSRTYDRGYGHFSTRQNIQYNWPRLQDVPDLLADLATVQMHAIQTSGNCIRNTTSDHLAGVARDELVDPRVYCEIIRQWSTLHPEFAFLPRKFKIAVTGAPTADRAAVRVHDIGVRAIPGPGPDDPHGFQILVGGGLGRTPRIAEICREFLPREHLLSYLEAILRVYNRYGRRDNKFKARIKILVGALGIEAFSQQVEAEWALIRDGAMQLTQAEFDRVAADFADPGYAALESSDLFVQSLALSKDRALGRFVASNVIPHKQPGYSIVMISLKAKGKPPGDATAEQMELVAELADRYGFGRIVVAHEQNLVLPDVESRHLPDLHARLSALDLAEPNIGKVTDIIACPGLDYCNLANARSIPIATRISDKIEDLDYLHDLGDISLNISGCINACGHHHVGNIGILGIDKQGEEFYQLMLGGSPGDDASIGKILGPALPSAEIVDAVANVLRTYIDNRESADERFLDYVRRAGFEPFKEQLYGSNDHV
ncbi:Sulfite reductase [NADPH] hemoprotein beta-component [Enhygromyxa salina]|uniref:Sulfite reductase [NADPH] hemoprotein beta-component n=1 Tax=Enhygromyxa salina TaxID=215803 RepID=A0A0C2D4A4_9BACT|nr:nitrite/sulfite reductase [Enhygromyxa salina]KIG18031.1 Sulfite reductase [NADPH] hemoprotein beta-component [Enhygromyxa salina]